MVLDDGEGAEISGSRVELFDLESGRALEPRPRHIEGHSIAAPTKGSYPHYLLKEIHEQPIVLGGLQAKFANEAEPLAAAIAGARRVYVVGCGTAYHAALVGSRFLADVAGIEAIPVIGSEMAAHERFIDESTVVVYLSQSGETVDLLQSLEPVRRKGGTTAALVNVPQSSLHRRVDLPFLLEAGAEISVVSTKAFVAKVACVGLLAYRLAGRLSEGQELLRMATHELERVLSSQSASSELDAVVGI